MPSRRANAASSTASAATCSPARSSASLAPSLCSGCARSCSIAHCTRDSCLSTCGGSSARSEAGMRAPTAADASDAPTTPTAYDPSFRLFHLSASGSAPRTASIISAPISICASGKSTLTCRASQQTTPPSRSTSITLSPAPSRPCSPSDAMRRTTPGGASSISTAASPARVSAHVPTTTKPSNVSTISAASAATCSHGRNCQHSRVGARPRAARARADAAADPLAAVALHSVRTRRGKIRRNWRRTACTPGEASREAS
eukprot:3216840-Pleurochrysis_carterae.AAC.2